MKLDLTRPVIKNLVSSVHFFSLFNSVHLYSFQVVLFGPRGLSFFFFCLNIWELFLLGCCLVILNAQMPILFDVLLLTIKLSNVDGRWRLLQNFRKFDGNNLRMKAFWITGLVRFSFIVPNFSSTQVYLGAWPGTQKTGTWNQNHHLIFGSHLMLL